MGVCCEPGSSGGLGEMRNDFFHDLDAGPIAFRVESADDDRARRIAERWRAFLRARGDFLITPANQTAVWPVPRVLLHITENACNGMVYAGLGQKPEAENPVWDFSLPANPPGIDAQVRRCVAERFADAWERRIASAVPPDYPLSVVVCTNRDSALLRQALEALATQTLSPSRFEVIVVNNAPAREDFSGLIQDWNQRRGSEAVPGREVKCPVPGLSHARNAGLLEAHGDIVLYLDDDAIADPTLCERLLAAYENHPSAGVIGGAIELIPPSPAPWWYGEALAPFWTDLRPSAPGYTACASWKDFPFGANWSARREALFRIGGFSPRYGRGGTTAASGEEVVAAIAIQRLGFEIGLTSEARVLHKVSPERFSLRELFKAGIAVYESMLAFEREGRVEPSMTLWGSLARGLARFAFALTPRNRSISERAKELTLGVGRIAAFGMQLRVFVIRGPFRRGG